MKAKRILTLIAAAVTGLVMCGCGAEGVSGGHTAGVTGGNVSSCEITDLVGRTVTVIPGSYSRAVCIGAGALRMYSYINGAGMLCGVEDIDNTSLEERPKMFDASARPYVMAYGDKFSRLPSCGTGGPSAQTAEAEKILSCAPDIVFSEYEDAEKSDALRQQLGVPVITLRSGPDGVFSEQFYQSLRIIGTVFDKKDRAEEIISFVEAEAKEIKTRTSSIPESKKSVVYIGGLGNWGTTNHLFTAPNYKTFEVANIKNAVSDVNIKGIGQIEAEKFAAVGGNIDIMFIDGAAVKNIKPLYKEDPAIFSTCKAAKNGEVYLLPAYNAYYTNYEIALANAWFIAKTVYPEQFADIDPAAKTNEITSIFLGKEMADDIFAQPASFGGYRKINVPEFFGG